LCSSTSAQSFNHESPNRQIAAGNFVPSVGGVSSGALRQRFRPLGRKFPKGKLLVKHQGSPIPDALAIEQRDVTSQDAAGNAKKRGRLANLHLDANPRQKTPVRFDERATRRQIDDMCETSRAQARSLYALGSKGAHPWRRAPFVP
jgi:hypothetical protein